MCYLILGYSYSLKTGGIPMYKHLFILCFTLLSSGIHASLSTTDNYIVVDNETFFCGDIHVGPSSFRVTTTDGNVKRISTARIDAYSQKGLLFERLPVINKKQDTAGWAYMQFISSRDGYKLYRYCSNCSQYDPSTGEIAPAAPVYRYYIFKDGKFITVTDDYNVKSLLRRFGVKRIC
jgi:hypothetical protein